MKNKKDPIILVLGGSGKLGSALARIDLSILAPYHSELDILDKSSLDRYVASSKPNIIIHCAAYTGPIRCDENPMKAMRVNIEGTCNVVDVCYRNEIRLVYISTDYVFKGDRGNYSEDDELLPQNLYAWSKLGGEAAARMYDEALIIRTTFSPDIFPYDKAFVDQYTSRDALSVIAPMILELARNNSLVGVIHVGTERKSVKELALRLGKKNVADISIEDVPFIAPRDTSFNLHRLHKALKIKKNEKN